MTEPRDVTALLHEIQAGDSPEESFRQIFELYHASVTHYFINRGFPRDVAEDLAQESFLRVYKNVGEFRFEASFETWLFHIVGSVWKNALRSRATLKRQSEQVSLDEAMNPNPAERTGAELQPEDTSDGPLDRALEAERTRLLTEALDELPPKMRECALLRMGQGLKYREIAALMQISIATVKTQLSMAHKRLKPLLEQHFDASDF